MAIATVESNQSSGSGEPARKKPRDWSPHIWEGATFTTWLRLVARNRGCVGWRQLYVAPFATAMSAVNSVLGGVQRLLYGRRIRNTVLDHPPVFIIGHWRTGTTLLHELMVQDPRHTFPTSHHCFVPSHLLLSEWLMTKYLWFLAPTRRPMDNMAVGWNSPQEDEFALCLLGQPSPYLTIAFPNRGFVYPEYLDLEGLSPRALERWKATLLRFLQTLTYRDGRRLVLKSPPHTCRIRVLQELFPGAIFIHIVRNPYVVFPSTVNLWKSLYRKHGLQTPTYAGLEDHVFSTFERMYARLEATRGLVAPERFYELRYEDLVREPVAEMQAMYDHLNLGGWDEVRPRLERYLDSVAGYETNRYELTPAQRAEIGRRWGPVIDRYGYGE
jgi:hypothetical protein